MLCAAMTKSRLIRQSGSESAHRRTLDCCPRGTRRGRRGREPGAAGVEHATAGAARAGCAATRAVTLTAHRGEGRAVLGPALTSPELELSYRKTVYRPPWSDGEREERVSAAVCGRRPPRAEARRPPRSGAGHWTKL
jgi:hypothetical protein